MAELPPVSVGIGCSLLYQASHLAAQSSHEKRHVLPFAEIEEPAVKA
jgi:hypothetical protein